MRTKKIEADADCYYCGGSGVEVHYSGHNGDQYNSTCQCIEAKRDAEEDREKHRLMKKFRIPHLDEFEFINFLQKLEKKEKRKL